jgi:hypothetical protein
MSRYPSCGTDAVAEHRNEATPWAVTHGAVFVEPFADRLSTLSTARNSQTASPDRCRDGIDSLHGRP